MSNAPTKTLPYTLICGLEIHAELKTQSKMFCGCKNDPFFAQKPNIYTCPVCLGMPGALPVANQKAIEWTIMLGLALGCKINLHSHFDRKHYFYPDLPKGYQISQYDQPFCTDGKVETSFGTVRIHRIHLEEDTAKLLHKTIDGEEVSLIDFNRGGVPLVEIVTEPDIHSAEQAKEYSKKIREILRYLEIADCDMEQGGMRLEANLSLQAAGETELPNYKVELKNINSFRYVEQAIAFEIERQGEMLQRGETPVQETRGWDIVANRSFSQRTKEEAEDYRYFPDPDLPPLQFTEAQIQALKNKLPILADEYVSKFINEFGVEKRFGSQLVSTPKEAEYIHRLFIEAKNTGLDSNKIASALVNKKLVVDHLIDQSPSAVIDQFKRQTQTNDVSEAELTDVIAKVLAENDSAVARYRAGEEKLLNFFIGQIMRELKKKVDTNQITELLVKSL